jgi:hypothetical protein
LNRRRRERRRRRRRSRKRRNRFATSVDGDSSWLYASNILCFA